MSALEDHPIDPIKKKKKKRLGRHSNSVLPTWGICNFRLNGKGPEDQGRTEYKHTGREKKQSCTFWKKPKGHPLWGPKLLRAITGANEPLFSLWAGRCSEQNLQTLDMLGLKGSAKGNSGGSGMFHPVRTAATQCYFIKSYICPFLFVLIPLYYFHFFLFPPPSSVALSSCLYLYRWNSIGEVIEKLSCRSGWFVGPVHALIHPAALPHK